MDLKGARSWKRRTQPRKVYSASGLLYSEGAPRIYGELLKLGLQIGETSVSKYMVRAQETAIPDLEDVPRESRKEYLKSRWTS
jgi:hypothetical protein